jgi:hypothetical protein
LPSLIAAETTAAGLAGVAIFVTFDDEEVNEKAI